MKNVLVAIAIYVLFAASLCWSQDAMHFLDMGLESSMMNGKVYYFSKALELNPKLSVAYEKRGMIYYFQENYEKTIEDFRKVVELNPTKSEAYRMLGLAWLKKGNHDEAITHLTQAIELNPRLTSAYSNRAESYLQKGMAEAAVRDASKAITLRGADPIIGRAYTVRSKAYRQLGKDELAEEDFNKAYILDPENYVYRYYTITNHLASFVSDSGDINARSVRRVGLVAIIAVLFALIFRLIIPSPEKRDTE